MVFQKALCKVLRKHLILRLRNPAATMFQKQMVLARVLVGCYKGRTFSRHACWLCSNAIRFCVMEDQKSHAEDGVMVCDICGKPLGQVDLSTHKEKGLAEHCRTPGCPNNPDITVGANH
jgi:hypothetical protein